jgi:hypothetical protein
MAMPFFWARVLTLVRPIGCTESAGLCSCAATHEMLLERSNCLVLPTETEITTDALVVIDGPTPGLSLTGNYANC